MESSGHQEDDFVNQEEEEDDELPERHENSSLGIGRSYECVFCKRGFNTAQALGGHMNIHRKDRARNKPSSSSASSMAVVNSNNTDHDPAGGFYHQIIAAPPRYHHQTDQYHLPSHHHHQQQYINHTSYCNSFRSSSSMEAAAAPGQPFSTNNHYYFSMNHQVRFNPFGFDQWSMSFNMPCGSSAHHVEDIEKSSRRSGLITSHQEDQELDLELRLGGPW